MAWLATEAAMAVGSGDWLGGVISSVKSNASNGWSWLCGQWAKLRLIAAYKLLKVSNARLKLRVLVLEFRIRHLILGESLWVCIHNFVCAKKLNADDSRLTKKAEPPPTYDIQQPETRSERTDRRNGGWLRRRVRPRVDITQFMNEKPQNNIGISPQKRHNRTASLLCKAPSLCKIKNCQNRM
jgi:hypothetical protein